MRPTGDAWVHEVKWDGMRVLVDVRDGVVTVWSRNERDVTPAYPELEELGRDYDDMLLDGEVVAFDADGRERPDWVDGFRCRPLAAVKMQTNDAAAHDWPTIVAGLAPQLGSRRPHAIAAVVVVDR